MTFYRINSSVFYPEEQTRRYVSSIKIDNVSQLEAARTVTGLTSYASILSIYKETGWEKLSVRREKRKLSLFYDIVSGQSPDYLQDLLPITVGLTNNYQLQEAIKLHLNRSHLRLLHF
jgi:hypothetical protein